MDLPRTLDEAHLVFDVDGVLTEEFARVDLQVMRLMNKKLIGARLLDFVTGRAAPWFDSHIASHSGHLDSARRVPRAAETGPVLWNGRKWRTDPAYVAPAELRATLKGLVDHPPRTRGPLNGTGRSRPRSPRKPSTPARRDMRRPPGGLSAHMENGRGDCRRPNDSMNSRVS